MILVVGATGATGKWVVRQLLERGEKVRAVIRSRSGLPDDLHEHENLEITEASVYDLSQDDLIGLVSGCRGVVSCLGHNLSFKGIYGHPRRLVRDVVQRLCAAISVSSAGASEPVKFILMNSTGCRNKSLGEKISVAEHLVVGLVRILVPPHPDNEQAVGYLREHIGNNSPVIEWVAVRPDSLVDESEVTDYDLVPSPVRSAIFDAGKTSRINVADFMSRLVCEKDLWAQWRFATPVIYNRESD